MTYHAWISSTSVYGNSGAHDNRQSYTMYRYNAEIIKPRMTVFASQTRGITDYVVLNTITSVTMRQASSALSILTSLCCCMSAYEPSLSNGIKMVF